MSAPLTRIALCLPVLAIAACSNLTSKTPESPPRTEAATVTTEGATASTATTAAVPRPTARTAAELNTTTQEQRTAAASAPATQQQKLGNTVASLGDPTQPGFWVKTPLVSAEADGRIVNPANGKSAKVRLIPLAGPASGGSQVSLPALQLIGVSLTDLPTIEVYRG